MCRIAGIIDHRGDIAQLQQEVKAMCDVMAHGGPDGEGFFADHEQGLVFGHRRLALIDLSPAGKQPMQYYNNRLIITFNGEIYNFPELKQELSDEGLPFASHSDTEVILAAYQHWGVAGFSRLQGMFAFALYDQLKQQTFLVRDPSGIKPLYYYQEQDKLVFSSEVKAFRQTTLSLTTLPEWKIYFLAFGHIPEPYTTLTEVKILEKGSYLFWDHREDRCQISRFHANDRKPYLRDENKAHEAISKALNSAVKKHLISDAPIGVFLSGGIDSTLLTLLASSCMTNREQLQTLSVNFSEQQFSEQAYQQEIAEKTGSAHSEYLIDQNTFEQNFPAALLAMDQPTTDGINSWFVNYFARQKGLKAVLSGIGGDELFGGYPSFKRMKLVRLLSRLPGFILKKGLNSKRIAIKRLYYLNYRNTAGKYLFLRGIYTPDEIAEILNLDVKQVDQILRAVQLPPVPDHLNPTEEAGWFESNLYMQNQLLKDTDAMSMQHGIEVRVPFLDQDLIQLLNSTAPEIRYQQEKPKGLLIDTFKNILPKSIWNRKKMGFTFPFQNWLVKNEIFLDRIKTVNPKVTELRESFLKGELHWSKVMALGVMGDGRWEIYNE